MILLSRVNLAYFEFDTTNPNHKQRRNHGAVILGIVAVETIMALIIAATKTGHRID